MALANKKQGLGIHTSLPLGMLPYLCAYNQGIWCQGHFTSWGLRGARMSGVKAAVEMLSHAYQIAQRAS